MSNPHLTSRFKKDVQLARKSGKDTSKLQIAMETIIRGEQLDQSYKPHPLKGQWVPSWECHVGPDWLLIWQHENPGEIIFQRTGTHSELFTKKARK